MESIGAKLVLSCCTSVEVPSPSPEALAGAAFVRVPLVDDPFPTFDCLPALETGVRAVSKSLAKGGAVLVHCLGGQNRSPSMCAAFLLRHSPSLVGGTVEGALAFMQSRRSLILVNTIYQVSAGVTE